MHSDMQAASAMLYLMIFSRVIVLKFWRCKSHQPISVPSSSVILQARSSRWSTSLFATTSTSYPLPPELTPTTTLSTLQDASLSPPRPVQPCAAGQNIHCQFLEQQHPPSPRSSSRNAPNRYLPSFDSPFKTAESPSTTKIPNFSHYMSKRSETGNRVFQYFMVGSMGLLAAAGAKATVQGRSQKE